MLPKAQDKLLVNAAKWCKSHGEEYCPITAIRSIPNWRKHLKALRKKGLAGPSKARKGTVKISKRGWDYLRERHPEVVRRRRRGIIRIRDDSR